MGSVPFIYLARIMICLSSPVSKYNRECFPMVSRVRHVGAMFEKKLISARPSGLTGTLLIFERFLSYIH